MFILSCWWLKPSGGGGHYFNTTCSISDFLEYHLPAANLALHGRFPIYGFLSQMNDYKICLQADSSKYLRDTYAAGAMVFPSKPPLYSFIAGWAYRIAGFKPQSSVWLNVLLLALGAASIAAAVHAATGQLLLSLLAALGLIALRKNDIYLFDAEILTVTIVSLLVYWAVWAVRSKSFWVHAIGGLLTALLLLAKGYYVLVVALITLAYLQQMVARKSFTFLRNASAFWAGLLTLWLPWIVFINISVQQDIPNRLSFSKKLEATAPHLLLQTHNDIFNVDGTYREEVVEDILKFHQYQHARENSFFLITNQLGDYNILNVHNEYCTDGDFHPEWRIIQTSFYNQLPPGLTKHQKLWRFYRQHPDMLWGLPLAKLKNAFKGRTVLFFLAVLLSLVIWCYSFSFSRALHLALLVTPFLALVAFYGDERFAQTADAAALYALFVGIASLATKINSVIRGGWHRKGKTFSIH